MSALSVVEAVALPVIGISLMVFIVSEGWEWGWKAGYLEGVKKARSSARKAKESAK